MFLSRLMQKLSGTRRKEIPLNLLSRLWIEKEMPGKATLPNPTVNQWAHKDIHQFHAQHIAPNLAVLGPAGPVIKQILTLLDASGDCAYSCSYSIDDPNEEKIPTGITLLEHSLNIARIAVDMIKKAHRDYDMILGKILIICLGHGIGALSPKNTIGGMPAKTLLILDPMIQELSFKQDIVLAILTACESNPKTDCAKILKAASFEAGKQARERARVISGMGHSDILNPDAMDIDKIRAAIHLPEENRS